MSARDFGSGHGLNPLWGCLRSGPLTQGSSQARNLGLWGGIPLGFFLFHGELDLVEAECAGEFERLVGMLEVESGLQVGGPDAPPAKVEPVLHVLQQDSHVRPPCYFVWALGRGALT